MAKKKVKKKVTKKKAVAKKVPVVRKAAGKRNRLALAVVALILNVLIIPGLGSLIGGKIRAGIWQIVLLVVGALLSLIWIGIPIVLVAWIWGLVTGVVLIQEARG